MKNNRLFPVVGAATVMALLFSGCSGSDKAGNNADGTPAAVGDAASYLPIGDEISTTVDPDLEAMVPEDIKKAGKINIAVDIPFPPMAMYSDENRAIGFDPELGRLLGQKIGVPVSVNQQAFDSVIPSLQAGRNDIIMSGMNDTADRRETLDFIDYTHGGFIALVRKGDDQGIKTVQDLCGKTVAVQKSTKQGEFLKEMNCGVKLMELPYDTDAQTALRAGKADAFVADALVAEYAAATVDNGNAFEVVRDPQNPAGFNPLYAGIGVLKEDKELTETLRQAFQKLIDEGAYAKLLERHGMSSYAVDQASINMGE